MIHPPRAWIKTPSSNGWRNFRPTELTIPGGDLQPQIRRLSSDETDSIQDAWIGVSLPWGTLDETSEQRIRRLGVECRPALAPPHSLVCFRGLHNMDSIILSASAELVMDGFETEAAALEWLKSQYGDNPPEEFSAWLKCFVLDEEDDSFNCPMGCEHRGDTDQSGSTLLSPKQKSN